jgi:predicted nucleic acid-binding protein
VICVVDASVAVKWFVAGQWALSEDDTDAALALLRASARGTVSLLQPPHFLAEVAAVLARKNPSQALRDIDRLATLDIEWAEPTRAYARAIELAQQLDHHLFDTLYHALALDTSRDAVLVTADRRYFDKARHLGRIAWLPDLQAA